MDFLKKFTDKQEHPESQQPGPQPSNEGGLMGQVNNMLGGGKQGEQNEDYLDKGVDFIQEHFLKQGDQSNESAVEQLKDEQISDFIRSQYKGATGRDFPIADKS